jgi:hypothetical protein
LELLHRRKQHPPIWIMISQPASQASIPTFWLDAQDKSQAAP